MDASGPVTRSAPEAAAKGTANTVPAVLSAAGSCLFAVRGLADEAVFRSRVARLRDWYGRLAMGCELHWSEQLRLGTGAIRFCEVPSVVRESGWLAHWGEGVPSSL